MKAAAHRRFYPETWIQCLLLLGFSGAFLKSWATGSIRHYLNPRLYPFVLFAGLAFLLMALPLLFRLLVRGRGLPGHGRPRLLPYLLFLVPILLMLVKPETAAAPQSAQLSGTQIAGLPVLDRTAADKGSFRLPDGPIRVEDGNYMALYSELWAHPEKYKGRAVECVGYVSKDGNGLPRNEFLAARDMMWCCAADLVTVGYLCRTEEAAALPEKSWVKISGTLDVTLFEGKQTPLIVRPVVTPVEKPAAEYIYPVF